MDEAALHFVKETGMIEPQLLTADFLKPFRPCLGELNKFRELFPDGMEVTKESVSRAQGFVSVDFVVHQLESDNRARYSPTDTACILDYARHIRYGPTGDGDPDQSHSQFIEYCSDLTNLILLYEKEKKVWVEDDYIVWPNELPIPDWFEEKWHYFLQRERDIANKYLSEIRI